MPDPTNIRTQHLEKAIQLVDGARDVQYGDPLENFSACANLWTAYLTEKYRGDILDEKQFRLKPEDVAWLNVLQKMARSYSPLVKADTYIDAAGYAALAGEMAERQKDEF